MIPAILKTRFNTNEILVSLMLTYVAVLFIDWTVRGLLRDPMSFGFPLTPMYPDAGMIARVDLRIGRLAQLHWGVPALVLSVVAWFILRRTMVGFQVQVMGDAPRAGRFAGFSPALVTVLVLVFPAVLPGLPAWSRCRPISASCSRTFHSVTVSPRSSWRSSRGST